MKKMTKPKPPAKVKKHKITSIEQVKKIRALEIRYKLLDVRLQRQNSGFDEWKSEVMQQLQTMDDFTVLANKLHQLEYATRRMRNDADVKQCVSWGDIPAPLEKFELCQNHHNYYTTSITDTQEYKLALADYYAKMAEYQKFVANNN